MPVELVASQRAKYHDIGQPLILGEAEGNVERHPVPDQKKAVNQVGVPAQFPALAASSAGRWAASGRRAAAIAAMPTSPSRATIASI